MLTINDLKLAAREFKVVETTTATTTVSQSGGWRVVGPTDATNEIADTTRVSESTEKELVLTPAVFDALKKVVKFAAKADIRRSLNAIRIIDGELHATDGHRLITYPVVGIDPAVAIILVRPAVETLLKHRKALEGALLKVWQSERRPDKSYARLELADGLTLQLSTVSQQSYPDIQAVIERIVPEIGATTITIRAEELRKQLKHATDARKIAGLPKENFLAFITTDRIELRLERHPVGDREFAEVYNVAHLVDLPSECTARVSESCLLAETEEWKAVIMGIRTQQPKN